MTQVRLEAAPLTTRRAEITLEYSRSPYNGTAFRPVDLGMLALIDSVAKPGASFLRPLSSPSPPPASMTGWSAKPTSRSPAARPSATYKALPNSANGA